MNTPIQKFLQSKSIQSNETAIVALLILGAMEHNNKKLLQKFDVQTIRSIMRQRRLKQINEAIQNQETSVLS
ncbi:hypothetical protein AWH56_008815 [Anaerobacillus isosaccharinicus]|uniref:Uncharacterized protein n=1 Tax=Anaerobacillus isosaccharinicus TaxID=1532552 RepID=A0A1S2L1F7_9BACI|nr:hypothetical protein [Anaerobacillus isosaccharinicus]MBA5588926.1 hypothetical protein [Anaerobacillus isosaccharinicus]QOY37663.1 hypothetical protein AWH56_008815 [Anaerobacillus isosaccharinicus]